MAFTGGVSSHHHDVLEDLQAPSRALGAAMGPTWGAFWRLHRSAFADGAVPARTKELIALAIAVVKRCDGCIAYHARGAAEQGATREEVAEVLGVALAMEGGPASVYGPRAFEAYEEFAATGSDAPVSEGDAAADPPP
jgi:AhpD family alkylhydroperoxidase